MLTCPVTHTCLYTTVNMPRHALNLGTHTVKRVSWASVYAWQACSVGAWADFGAWAVELLESTCV
jgi:hypothetical protein